MLMNFHNKIISCLFFCLFFLWVGNEAIGQGWEKSYGAPAWDISKSVIKTSDKGYAFIGTTANFGPKEFNIYLVKTDVDGDILWQQTYGINDANVGADVLEMEDGGYLILGHTGNHNGNHTDIILIKTDNKGKLIWQKFYGGAKTETAINLLATTNYEFFIVGQSNSYENRENDILLIKVNADGDTIWSQNFGTTEAEVVGKAILNLSEEVIITGQSFDNEINTGSLFLLKVNPNGEETLFQTYDFGGLSRGTDLLSTVEGNILVTGHLSSMDEEIGEQAFLFKTNIEGDSLWFKSYGDNRSVAVQDLADGSYFMASYGRDDFDSQDIFLLKTTSEGEVIWEQNYGGSSSESCSDLILDDNESPIILGETYSFDQGLGDIYMIHTDKMGQVYHHQIGGQVVYDSLQNCYMDTLERGLPNMMITASNVASGRIFYGWADKEGQYSISVDTGTYRLNLHLPNNYWVTCQDSILVSALIAKDTLIDFFVQADRECPLLEVDISTPLLRLGYSNTYTVRYQNQGTTLAEDAYIEVDLDTFLSVNSFNIPIVGQEGNSYTFDIGDVEMGEYGQFSINTTLDTSAYAGQSHCTTAHISPDSLCLPINEEWDGASIAVEGYCDQDSVKFLIRNVGEGDMENDLNYFVIEDDITVFIKKFNLDSGADTLVNIPANGSTYHLWAEQSPGHPGISLPRATVEACLGADGGEPSLGYVSQFAEDDGNPFISIDCQPNVSSFDPNDKQAFPTGSKEEGCIEPNTDIEYLIRFQNTGTDTAFLVVLRDTLDVALDLTTLRPGASSHPYEMDVYGEGILKFTFRDIMLPDSTSNEAESHGFIKFKIAQQKDNPVGTNIANSAAIYFDFNEPVITNQVYHLVGAPCFEINTNTTNHINVSKEQIIVKVFPNPSNGYSTFEILNHSSESFDVRLYNLAGQEVYHQQFFKPIFQTNWQNVANGLYVYEIMTKEHLSFFGKIMIQR